MIRCLPPLVVLLGVAALVQADPQPAIKLKTPTSQVSAVTVYRNTALVTRDVDVPEGAGAFELVVSPLPNQLVEGSLYSEGTDGIRVLATRHRTRAVKEDTREEVRKLEAQLKELQLAGQKIQGDQKTIEQNLAMVTKLEGFTGSSLVHLTDKGFFSSDAIMSLAKYVMETRNEKAREQVSLTQQWQNNQEQLQFAQRQLQELSSGGGKTEHDGIIVVDKKNAAAGKVRLNYLVSSASWRPQYKLRAGKDKEPVLLEYLAAVEQSTGEDWNNVSVTLSTAQPMLNAAPPELKMLDVAVIPMGPSQPGGQQAAGMPGINFKQADQQAKQLRGQAQQELNYNKKETGGKLINDAAALEQCRELLQRKEDEKAWRADAGFGEEGPSVVYNLGTKLSIPSRNDEQVIQVARVDLMPDYFYKAVPVLTPHVYRQANLTNKSEHVLLPGEATMYIGTDFVGRTTLPLVAVGEQFTAGFGVDPQLQVQRRLLDKSRTMQGGNQVLKYEYRILVSSYKPEPVKLQLWDRLPHAESSTVAVTLNAQAPALSKDPVYQREERTKSLLRWDLVVEPSMTGEKALAVNYDFKLELDKQMQIGQVTSK